MQQTGANYEWLSVHLFYTGSADKLLCNTVQPFLKQTEQLLHSTCPYFFIRYAEEGLHLRLRLQIKSHLLQTVKTMLEADLSGSGTTIKYVPYVPETTRYGNQRSLAIAESLFHASAACSINYITGRQPWDTSAALLAACQMHICFFHALEADDKKIKKICTHFVQAWLTNLKAPDNPSIEKLNEHLFTLYNRQAPLLQQMALTLWRQLQTEKAPTPLQNYSNTCRPLLAQYKNAGLTEDSFHYALRSLLHMTNNRLGLPNKEEAWCVFITEQCLQYIYEQAE